MSMEAHAVAVRRGDNLSVRLVDLDDGRVIGVDHRYGEHIAELIHDDGPVLVAFEEWQVVGEVQ